jgi:hypothetical protein
MVYANSFKNTALLLNISFPSERFITSNFGHAFSNSMLEILVTAMLLNPKFSLKYLKKLQWPFEKKEAVAWL